MLTKERRKSGPLPAPQRPHTVAIVDDQPEVLVALRRVLREEPFDLATFASPIDALAWMVSHPVDLLIVDERMPEMRGTDLLDRVKERYPKTIRVILTGYPGCSTVEYGLAHGVDWLISKPWNDDAFRITLRQLLDERANPATGGATPARRPTASENMDEFLEFAPVPLSCVSPGGVILWANRAELDFLGYTRTEYVGRPVGAFHEEPKVVEDLLRRISRGEEMHSVDARVRRKDGSMVDVVIDANARTADGAFVQARFVTHPNPHRQTEAALIRAREELEEEVGERTRVLQETNYELVHEIAERKRAEDTQRLSEMRFRLLVEGVKDYAILMLSPEGIVVSWNSGAEGITGYPAEEILGRNYSVLHPPEDVAAGKPERLLEAASREGRVEDEGWGVHKDGSRFWSNAVITALHDADGRLIGFSKVTRDMTERRKAEEERARLQASMLQGQKLQAIGQLSAGIAHEINNPVGYILSNLNTMGEYVQDLRRMMESAAAAARAREEGRDPSEALAAYARVAKEVQADHLLLDLSDIVSDCKLGGEKIRDIVRSLREFSHVDPSQVQPTDLNKCLDDALRICWNELKYKATVHKDYGKLPAVPCYAQRLGQVFINLLVNAGQAIDKKGEVHLSTRAEGEEAVIRVRDSGRGIAPEHLGKLFEPFFTTKEIGAGTGLGLHVAYKIVTAHRGKISVSSEVGKGTEFTIRIPLSGPHVKPA